MSLVFGEEGVRLKKLWSIRAPVVLTGLSVAGIVSAQTSLSRDSVQRERQQQEASDAEAMRKAADNYVVIAPGVARDKSTGLEWMRCSIGQKWSDKTRTCFGGLEKHTFDGAQEVARKLNDLGGYNGKVDWRVPTKDELVTLVLCTKGRRYDGTCQEGSSRPAVAQTVFPETASIDAYWTSLPTQFRSYAWLVHFSDGHVFNGGNRGGQLHVRLVRSSR